MAKPAGEIGLKAARLSLIGQQLGFVPRFRVLSGRSVTLWLRHALGASVQTVLDALVAPPRSDDAARWAAQFLAAPVPRSVVDQLTVAAQRLSQRGPLACRSSHLWEDDHAASYAGLLRSELNVPSDNVVGAVQHVVAQLFDPQFLTYAGQFGQVSPNLSVIIQEMVTGEGCIYGVCHTQASEQRCADVVSLTAGLHPVSGTSYASFPENYLIHRQRVEEGRSARLQFEPGADSPSGRALLTDDAIQNVVRRALDAERLLGSPVEVEWALTAEGVFSFLQVRPLPGIEPPQAFGTAPTKDPLIRGIGIGTGLFHGRACRLAEAGNNREFGAHDIVVIDELDDRVNQAVLACGAVVTAGGGRTAHVSRLCREMGKLCVAAAGVRIDRLCHGETYTLVCSDGLEGAVYAGTLERRPIEANAPDEVCVRSASEAFDLANRDQVRRVIVDLGRLTRALTASGLASQSEASVSQKYAETIGLVCTAFAHARIDVRALEPRWRAHQAKACDHVRQQLGFDVRLVAR